MRPFLTTFDFLPPAANKCRSSVRVLVPGAGLGRLAFDIASEGEALVPPAPHGPPTCLQRLYCRFQLPRYVDCLHRCSIGAPHVALLNPLAAIAGNDFSF